MKRKLLSVLVVLMGLFLLSASMVWAQSAPVTKTGQTTSYRTGDDGDHQKGVANPSPRFTDNRDGTVTDNLTGLMWARDANLINGTMTWNDAIDYANNLSFGSYGCGEPFTDWRLPNVRELLSLVDFGNANPALPSGHPFTNVLTVFYWTSTTDVVDTTLAWDVAMTNGNVSAESKSGDYRRVWPVRGGN